MGARFFPAHPKLKDREETRLAHLFSPPSSTAVKLGVPDLVTNSYFPAITAVELGCFKARGGDHDVDLICPQTMGALQETFRGVTSFTNANDLTSDEVRYEDVIPTQPIPLWRA